MKSKKRNYLTVEQIVTIWNLRKEGLLYSKISEKLGLNRYSVDNVERYLQNYLSGKNKRKGMYSEAAIIIKKQMEEEAIKQEADLSPETKKRIQTMFNEKKELEQRIDNLTPSTTQDVPQDIPVTAPDPIATTETQNMDNGLDELNNALNRFIEAVGIYAKNEMKKGFQGKRAKYEMHILEMEDEIKKLKENNPLEKLKKSIEGGE